jgi:signal transduction histidine kinase
LHHKEYLIHRDSVFNQDNIRKMLQLQLQHEFDKKEEAIKLEQQQKDIRQRRQFIFISIISLLVFVLAIVFYRDQKRIAKINQQLKLESENLEEENREKESILKIVSHDLRAPFGKIKGLADLLQYEHDLTEAEKKQYFEYIQTSIDQGIYLISHLLEVQTVNHPAIPSFQVIDVVRFVHDFEQIVQGQLIKKQQQLQLSVEPGKLELFTDKQMLTRILDNIVSNASKFSNQRKTIYLRVWSENHMIYFSVRDEGPGISSDDQKKLFRKFQKLSAQPTAGEHSTGLGLSITKALVDQLNGTIQVKSALGKGTEVIISLRYSPAAI